MRVPIVLAMLIAVGGGARAHSQVPPFVAQTPPPAPDYTQRSAWAAGPGGGGASDAVPPGASRRTRRPAADVFFVHPTTLRGKARWNQDLADADTNRWTDASSIARQASIFNGCCRIFAPRYRQAALLSDQVGSRDRALDLAFSDIERAFDLFLARHSKGRPFILAGHSQGGLAVARLIEKRISGTALKNRLVAAYAIGMNLAEGEPERRFADVPVCQTAAQTGCLVQWNAVLPSVDLTAFAAGSEKAFVDRYGDVPGRTTLCVNPLTFDRRQPEATEARSQGAVPGAPNADPLRALVPGSVSARCERGALVVRPAAGLGLDPLPGGSMHYHDLGLFYADVRANAAVRVTAFLERRRRR